MRCSGGLRKTLGVEMAIEKSEDEVKKWINSELKNLEIKKSKN